MHPPREASCKPARAETAGGVGVCKRVGELRIERLGGSYVRVQAFFNLRVHTSPLALHRTFAWLFTGKVFISTPRGHRTGAHTDATSNRSRAPGPPYNSRTPISRRAGPQRLAPLGRLKRRRGPPCALAAQAARGRRLAEGLPQGAVTGTSVAQRSVATAGVLSGKTPSLSTTPSPTSSTAGPSASPQALETGSPAYRLPAACGFARAIAAPRPQQRS